MIKLKDDDNMTFSYPEIEIFKAPEDLSVFERATRTCYKSEDKMKDDSDLDLLNMIMSKGHTAMIEFIDDLIVRFKTSRGVTHELVRMRLCSFAQESTRYVKYDSVDFIIPHWASKKELLDYDHDFSGGDKIKLYIKGCRDSATNYSNRIEAKWKAQDARGCLNNDVSALINMKTNMREWLHVFDLRCDAPAHPDMRVLMVGLLGHLNNNNRIVKALLLHKPELQRDLDWFNETHSLYYKNENHFVIVSDRDL